MTWKSKLIGRVIPCLTLIFLFCTVSAHAQYRYKGVIEPSSANIYWKNYTEDIQQKRTQAISDALILGIANMDLFEYSLILEELLKSYENVDFENNWLRYMDSLQVEAKKNTMRSGLIPLQSQFFHATLEANMNYMTKYPEAFHFLKGKTPLMVGLEWKPDQYNDILNRYAFSEAVGEGIIMDFLMLEDVNLLEIINNNPKLKERYLLWVDNLGDIASAFHFSALRPPEMFTRKKMYLSEKLRKSKHPLAQKTWEPVKQIMIMEIPAISSDHFFRILNGTWEGIYIEDKRIQITLNPMNNINPDRKLKGQNKFSTQTDHDLISMEGFFQDKSTFFEVIMYELPKTKLQNGVFKVTVDKKTQEMKGVWMSYNNTLTRRFNIPKKSEGLK